MSIFTANTPQIENNVPNQSPANFASYDSTYLSYEKPSDFELYTIPKGTQLYHGSTFMRTFNPYKINLGKENLLAFFSPKKGFAVDAFSSCNKYPVEEGYLHKFVTNRPIENIAVISTFNIDKDWTTEFIEKKFCNSADNKFNRPLNGIAFYYPRLATNSDPVDANHNNNAIVYDSDFALCNPADYLDYQSTQSCISRRKLGDETQFNQ